MVMFNSKLLNDQLEKTEHVWTKTHPWAAGHPVARRFCRDQKTHPPIAGEIAWDDRSSHWQVLGNSSWFQMNRSG